jgi:hypothetical protein
MGDIWERVQSIGPRPGSIGQFGTRVALGAGRLAIGSPWSDQNGVELGYVDLDALDAGFGTWLHEATLTPSNIPPGTTVEFAFGRSLDIDGPVLVVGANRFFGGRGLVFVFERSGNVWSQVEVLSGSPFQADANFGDNVHVSGDAIAITQPGAGIMVDLPGRVYAYRRSMGAWVLEQTLIPNAGSSSPDDFGGSAALDGDRLVARSSGDLRAYQHTGNAWIETWSAVLGGGRERYALSMDGTALVVGTPDSEVGGVSQAGDVRIYRRRPDETFLLGTTAAAPSPSVGGEFGHATAIDGDRVIVGEPGAERAHVFRRSSGLSILP